MPTITDYFTKASSGTRPVPTTTTATVASGASPGTITCAALTGWATTTPVHFIIYTTDANGNKVSGSQIDCKGIVVGNTITGTVVKAGTNLGFSVGAIVEAAPTAAYADDLATGLAVSHNADGSLTTSSVQTALGLSSSIGAGWTPLANTFTYGANNGNKEYTVTATADLTSVVGPGMKFQLTRGTSAPTQAMAFTAASSQYGTKATPTGITFTGAFTCEAWIYLNSYPTSSGGIIGRSDNSTGGFVLRVNASGQLEAFYGSASTFTTIDTYQSIPLKRWAHVGISVSSVATKTAAAYINGSLVPSVTAGAATALTQVGNLSVGAISTGAAGTFFDGYISEARVWSAAQSQASIQANMAINLVGNETNLVALFKGNGNFTDTTANVNTLTASGGAIATQAANPYNNVEYSIITKVSYSAPTTTLTLFGGTDYTIPNMTLSSPQYSALKSPVGFNSARGKWRVDTIKLASETSAIGATNNWTGSFHKLTIPTGDWIRGIQYAVDQTSTVSGVRRAYFTVADTTPVNSVYNQELTVYVEYNTTDAFYFGTVMAPYSITSPATSILYGAILTATGSETFQIANRGPCIIWAECAWV